MPPVHEANIKRIEIPTWSLTIDHVLKWEEITTRRYPAFDRAKERVAIGMAVAEDDEIFAVLAMAATITPNTGADLITIPGSISKAALADLYGIIAGRQLVPSSYVLNSRKYSDILKFSSNDLDQVSLNITVDNSAHYASNSILASSQIRWNS